MNWYPNSLRDLEHRALPKWSATCRPQTGRSACTSAKRNGAHSTADHSESVRLRWFLIGAAFAQFANIVLALWVRAGGM